MRRFVVPEGQLNRGDWPLPPEVQRHVRVLRLAAGETIELTDGAGIIARGELLGEHAVCITHYEAVSRPPGPEVVLLQGVGKGDKLELVVRQAAELGAARIVPVVSDRAVARREGKHDRLKAVADDALRVAGGAYRTEVDAPTDLSSALTVGADLRLVFCPGAADRLRDRCASLAAARRVAALVGPEGGFDRSELDLAIEAGFLPVTLGPSVLRTETAGPAVVALLGFAAGRLG